MKKLFTNDKFFLAMVLCAVIGEGLYSVLSLVNSFSLISSVVPMMIRVLCVVFLYSSYRKHSKNVMKGLMGALLMAQVLNAITLFGFGNSSVFLTATRIAFLVLNLALFINHFIINSDHHSSSKNVTLNQVIVILLAVLNTVRVIYLMTFLPGTLSVIRFACDIIGYIGMTAIVVCVESRLDAYRLDREAAGWTEEKGYPENYIHQKDR